MNGRWTLLIILVTAIAAQESMAQSMAAPLAPPPEMSSLLNAALADIAAMRDAGLGTTKAELTLAFARNRSLEPGGERVVRELVESIARDRRLGLETLASLESLDQEVLKAEGYGLVPEDAKDTIALARSALHREDYPAAYDRASQAAIILVLETKGEFSAIHFLRKYGAYLLPGALALGGLVTFIVMRWLAGQGDRRLKTTIKEEVVVRHLMKRLQDDYYLRKSVPRSAFHKNMYDYNRRLARLQRRKATIRAQLLRQDSEHLRQRLRREEGEVTRQLHDLQESYFKKQTVDKDHYAIRQEELSRRLAELELLHGIQEKLEGEAKHETR